MRINEIFNCIQGEGKTQGQFRTAIRMNGCNLSCSFCDTKYTWGKGDEHITSINDFKDLSPWLMLTGGEPCTMDNWDFIKRDILSLPNRFDWIEVETNGTQIPDKVERIDLWNISPKNPKHMVSPGPNFECEPIFLARTHELRDYIVKFVIKDEDDLDFMDTICRRYSVPKDKIWIMPYTMENGYQHTKVIYDIAMKRQINFSARLHVMLQGNKRGI